jgi:hypothetical protein
MCVLHTCALQAGISDVQEAKAALPAAATAVATAMDRRCGVRLAHSNYPTVARTHRLYRCPVCKEAYLRNEPD